MLKVQAGYGKRNKIIQCVKKFKIHIRDANFLFDEYFDVATMDKIYKWKKKRDDYMHSLEKNYRPLEDDAELKAIAIEGRKLMRSLTASIMSWKKQAKYQKLVIRKS